LTLYENIFECKDLFVKNTKNSTEIVADSLESSKKQIFKWGMNMMELKFNTVGGISVLEVWGDLQYTNWKDFVNGASELIEQGQERIVVSWEHAEYIDSSAMGALVTIHKLFKRFPKGKAVVYAPHEDHIFILQQAHFQAFLEIYDNLDKAVESCMDPASTNGVHKASSIA
jgi:anti-anti-sigma factor